MVRENGGGEEAQSRLFQRKEKPVKVCGDGIPSPRAVERGGLGMS